MRFRLNGITVVIILLLVIGILSLFHVRLNITDLTLFFINGQPITVFNIIILSLLLWVLRQLASPLRELVLLLLVLWVISIFGGAFLSGISSILLLVIFLLIVFQFLGWFL